MSWRPGPATAAVLTIGLVCAIYVVSPIWWPRLGNDSRVFYAAAQVQAGGGNPYDFAQLATQERSLNQSVQGADPRAFDVSPYAYPPLMTWLWRLLLPVGERGFYAINALGLLAAGIAGLELLMAGIDWRNRWWARLAFVVSPATVEVLVSGNPSTLLLLAWALGFFAWRRGRPFIAGLALAGTLVKPPIGLVIDAALIVAMQHGRLRATAGLGVGAVAMAALNLLPAGIVGVQQWLPSLSILSSTLATAVPGYHQCCLAGMPAFFVDQLPALAATALAASLVAAALAWALLSSRGRAAIERRPLLLPALWLAGALAVSPYLHLNDLVLESLPLLALATVPLTWLSRLPLSAWGLGAAPPIILAGVLASMGGTVLSGSVGYGAFLSTLILAALVGATARYSPPPASDASQPPVPADDTIS